MNRTPRPKLGEGYARMAEGGRCAQGHATPRESVWGLPIHTTQRTPRRSSRVTWVGKPTRCILAAKCAADSFCEKAGPRAQTPSLMMAAADGRGSAAFGSWEGVVRKESVAEMAACPIASLAGVEANCAPASARPPTRMVRPGAAPGAGDDTAGGAQSRLPTGDRVVIGRPARYGMPRTTVRNVGTNVDRAIQMPRGWPRLASGMSPPIETRLLLLRGCVAAHSVVDPALVRQDSREPKRSCAICYS